MARSLIVIGASTGGPRALGRVLSRLPAGLPAAVLIAQHMPALFTRTLADRLNRCCPLEVREATDRELAVPGQVLVAPGGTQMTVQPFGGGLRVRVQEETGREPFHPSVDRLFHSAAVAVGSSVVGVVLTGMGDDGCRGLQALRDAGAYTLSESESTAVVYGMPRCAASAAREILPVDEIGPALSRLCGVPSRPDGPGDPSADPPARPGAAPPRSGDGHAHC